MNPTSYPSPLVSVIAPIYGCAGCLEDLCERLARVLEASQWRWEILLVCDASPDDSWRRIEELCQREQRIRGIRLSRNFGQHPAISAGLGQSRGDWVVVMDCDLQDPPEAVAELLGRAQQGFDAVIAERKQRRDGWFKRATSRAFYALLSYLTGERYNPETANFGAYSRRLVNVLNRMPESGRFFPLMVRWAGFAQTTHPVQHAQRPAGESSYGLMKSLRLALDAILSFSDRPLRLVVRLGLTFSFLSFVMVLFSLWRYLDGDIAVAGFTSIVASIWLVGGAMLASLGVVGLYVGRIFNQVKGRPHYLIAESLNEPTSGLPACEL